MAPSSSDMVSFELARENMMDFQPSSFPSEVQPGFPQQQQQQQQHPHHHRLHHPQQQSVSQHPHSQSQANPQQLPHADLHSSLQPPHQVFGLDGSRQQQQFVQQQQQHHQSFPPQQQQQQLNSDAYPTYHAIGGETFSQRQQMRNSDQQQPHHAHHSRHESFASLTNPPPPASTSGSSSQPNDPQTQAPGGSQFDIFEWYPKYQSCQQYFATHAQQSGHVQAVAAFVNIALPFQRALNPIPRSSPSPPPPSSSLASPSTPPAARSSTPPHQTPSCISLIPYLRRLVVTGLDFPGVLHGFFGDDWVAGVGPLHEQERRNYLFAAKSGGWASVKKDYDMLPLETVPFLRPLQGPVIAEIEAAEKSWSEWLAMEDWMVGPRAPEGMVPPGAATTNPATNNGNMGRRRAGAGGAGGDGNSSGRPGGGGGGGSGPNSVGGGDEASG